MSSLFRPIIFSCLLFCLFFGILMTKADQNYDVHSTKNQTVRVIWTYQSTEPHYIRCIADATDNPNKPELHWTLDLETNDVFTGGNLTTVEASNPQDIKITFNDIQYEIIQDYYCVASNATKKLINFTYFKVLVETPTSKATVFGALVLLTIFMVAAFIIIRIFKINEGSTKIDL